MRLAVFSDSHGYPSKMLHAIEACAPDMIIHLGDGGSDISKIKMQFPHIPLKAVGGNCDFSSELPKDEIIAAEGIKLFITHGHLYGVKGSLTKLVEEASAMNVNAVLYGHTHIADNHQEMGLYVINPGSCGYPPNQSYAEIIITDKGELFSRIVRL